MGKPVAIPYRPHPGPQTIAHSVLVDELLYGGAAGGGKTEFVIHEAIRAAVAHPGTNVLVLRRTFPQLARPGGIRQRLLFTIPTELATWNTTEARFTFANGSVIELGYLARDADVLNYQGAEYALIIFDELTQFTEWQYLYMRSRLRVTRRLYDAGVRPRTIATANPGGPGHGWVKARWVDPAPPGVPHRPEPTAEDSDPGVRLFVPAKVADNPSLDPGYVRRLDGLPEDERRALRDGDWDVFAGQRFRAFSRAVHVVDLEQLGGMDVVHTAARRGIGVDYGLDAPYAALWGAALADDLLLVYREDYTAGLTPTEQAARILERTTELEAAPTAYVDPSTWARSPHVLRKGRPGAPPPGSIAAVYASAGLKVAKANNDRLTGVAAVADRLRVREDGQPRLLIASTCVNLIRTLPTLPRDPKRPEDVDTKAEDHAYDALRYLALGIGRGVPGRPDGDAAARPGERAAATAGAAALRREAW